jgi:hypothetical protein
VINELICLTYFNNLNMMIDKLNFLNYFKRLFLKIFAKLCFVEILCNFYWIFSLKFSDKVINLHKSANCIH